MLANRLAIFLAGLICMAASSAWAQPSVLIKTNQGNIVVELDSKKAPATVANFLRYVDTKHYNGTICHRVIAGFMIQGGGITQQMQEKATRAPIKNEADNGLQNSYGTIAMARTDDPHSATAQFFINVAENTFLNHSDKSPRGWGYAVFGKVTKGMEVVDKISRTQAQPGDVPVKPIVIESITRQ